MLTIKLRPILLGTLYGVLTLYAFSLLVDKISLENQYQHLLNESGRLQKVLLQIEQQHHTLLKGLQGNEKDAHNLKDSLETLKRENESLQFTAKKNEARIESIKEEKSYLEEMLINKTKQIEILNSQKGPADPAATTAPAESGTQTIDQAVTKKDEELKRLNEQNHVLQDKLDRLYKTTNAKINEINIAKIALEETVSTAKKKIEDEWNTVNLGSVTTSAVPDRTPETSGAKEPKAEGHVLAINNEHGFVVIDLGKVDNLPPDAMLEVRKDGQTIATLSVLEIRDVMAACNIKDVQNGQKIEINDLVSILR